MKKIYALLLMMLPLAASAQTMSLTVDGKTVKNGETFTKTYDTDEKVIIEGVYSLYGLFPDVKFTTTEQHDINFSFKNTSEEGSVQCCFGTNCRNYDAGKGTSEPIFKTVEANTPEDMRIECTNAAHSETAFSRSMTLYFIDEEGETFSCTLVLKYDPAADGIKGVSVNKNNKVYNLAGQQVKKATKGLYIINGKKVLR